jgi:predicted small lipoprotein YifL/soluble cytochrome b562
MSTNSRRPWLPLLLIVSALVLLAACGDGGPTSTDPADVAAWTVADPLADVLKSTDGVTPHSPEDRVARLTEVLGLSDEQAAAFLDACLAFEAAVADLRAQVEAGELTHEEAHAQAALARETFEATVQTVLTAEQWDLLQEMRHDHDTPPGGGHHGDDHHDGPDHVAHWTEWLTAVGADQAQTDAILAGMDAMRAALEDLRAAVRAGEMTFEEARAEAEALRAGFDQLLQDTLTAEQYAALLELRPDHGGRRHH